MATVQRLDPTEDYTFYRVPSKRFGYYTQVALPKPEHIGNHPEVLIYWWNTRFANNPRPSWRWCKVSIEEIYEFILHWSKGYMEDCLDLIESLTVIRTEKPIKPKTLKKPYQELREIQRIARLSDEELTKALRKRKIANKAKYLIEVCGFSPQIPVRLRPRPYWTAKDIRDNSTGHQCNTT